jgi:SagB-type dehydrogenase family enzyme
LRRGDHRGAIVDAAGAEPALASAPCAIVNASTFWRNAWKYRARAYRHCFWDNGTILANLLAACAARDIPAKLVLGFVDVALNSLLGLDSLREAPLSIVALGSRSGSVPPPPAVQEMSFSTAPLSKTEVDYPAMRTMHEASSLASKEDVIGWRENALTTSSVEYASPERQLLPLRPIRNDATARDSIEEVILRRGSTREFARASIGFAELSTSLDRAARGIDCDFLARSESLNDLYLIVHAVEDLPPGAYIYRRRQRALELLKEGNFREHAGELGLNQDIPRDCSINIHFLADLHRALARFGNRGYRAAQLEAAIMGGKLYLAAYALRLGASGLTFFDDDVTDFFSPDAAGKSVMFLTAIGKSARQSRAHT